MLIRFNSAEWEKARTRYDTEMQRVENLSFALAESWECFDLPPEDKIAALAKSPVYRRLKQAVQDLPQAIRPPASSSAMPLILWATILAGRLARQSL